MLTVIYLFALYGIGRIIEKVFLIFFPYPFTIILGLACLIFLGGILNLAGIAYPLVLDAIILAGLGYFTITFFKDWKQKLFFLKRSQILSKSNMVKFLPSALLIGIVFVFSAYALSSPEVFNVHDDLEKYINHPIRMLSTGSLRGGHFNALGSETLGGQAFLHGFVAAHWPIGYVNSVDSVFGLALCLMAVGSAAFSVRLPVWYTPLVLAFPVFINPQIVNISASYTASALMLFLFCGTWIELKDRDHSPSPWPHAICTGLVYSALVVLKTSFLLLPVAHFSVLSLGLAIYTTRLKEVFSWAIKVVISSIIFLLPWIMIYSSRLPAFFSDRSYLNISLQETDYFRHTAPIINPFSLDPLFWGFGANFADYTLTILLIGFCGIILIVFQFPNYQSNKVLTATAIAACLTLPLLYGLNIFIISSMLFGPESSLRYLCPVIIAAAPSALIMAATSVSGTNPQVKTKRLFVKRPIFIVAFFSLILLVAFFSSFSERVKQAFTYGSILSFSNVARDPKYIAYNHYVFSADAKKKVHTAQQIVPKHESLAAWTSLALYLDYQRNHIMDIEPAGLISPWADFPFGHGIEDGITYFKALGIDYVLWQYRGYAVRSEQSILDMAASPYEGFHMIGVKTHQFLEFLINLTKQSEILYNDGSIVILKLPSSNKIN
jgi:hypothetical protein